MNYISLLLIDDEALTCNCGTQRGGQKVYLVGYIENTWKTAIVRCAKCFRKDVEEKLDRMGL